MINFLKIVFFSIIIIIFSNNVLSLNSSSYLISKSAFNNHDFFKVLHKMDLNDNLTKNSSLIDMLIASIITENLILSNKIANKILLSDNDNQEAKLFNILNNIIKKDYKTVFKYRLDSKNNKNELFEFIFFNNDKIKSNNEISNSFLEIVKNSYSNNILSNPRNYNLLLFYVSLAVLIDSSNDEAIFLKASLFEIINKYTQAEMYYFKINNKSKFYDNAQQSIAVNYIKFLDYNEAEENIKKLIKENNNNYDLKKILADFYRINKRYQLAIETYNSLINKKKDNLWNIYYLRGTCYERLNQWMLAEKDFLTSLDINPESPNVLNYLAYGWIEKNIHIDKSLIMLEKAYKANPQSYYILDSLAWAYYKKNNFEKAAKLMEKVIDMAPGEAISLDHLGDIYFSMNRKREAIHFWKQAIDLAEPEDKILKKIEDKLRGI